MILSPRPNLCRFPEHDHCARQVRALAALVLVLVVVVAAAAACGGGDERAMVRVFASASLADAFGALEEEFEAAHEGIDVELHLAGTPVLVQQLEQGAPAGVLAAADRESMESVAAMGRTAGEPAVFAHTTLELVVAAGNPEGVRGLTDLARPELVVAVAADEVPAGRYAARALAAAGVAARPDTLEPSVKAVVSKVALGEVDVGLVYRTDVAATRTGVEGVTIPAAQNVRADLVIAVLDGGGPPARAFVDFVRSDTGDRILEAAGFEVPA